MINDEWWNDELGYCPLALSHHLSFIIHHLKLLSRFFWGENFQFSPQKNKDVGGEGKNEIFSLSSHTLLSCYHHLSF
jgi:hypothetical protein